MISCHRRYPLSVPLSSGTGPDLSSIDRPLHKLTGFLIWFLGDGIPGLHPEPPVVPSSYSFRSATSMSPMNDLSSDFTSMYGRVFDPAGGDPAGLRACCGDCRPVSFTPGPCAFSPSVTFPRPSQQTAISFFRHQVWEHFTISFFGVPAPDPAGNPIVFPEVLMPGNGSGFSPCPVKTTGTAGTLRFFLQAP